MASKKYKFRIQKSQIRFFTSWVSEMILKCVSYLRFKVEIEKMLKLNGQT